MSHPSHSLPYNNQDDMQPDFNHYPSDRLADSAAEGRTVLYPSQLHPHPLFTRQGNAGPIQNRSLELHHHVYASPSFTQQQSWPPYDNQQTCSYPPFPTPSPFPPPRLSPPPIHHSPINFGSRQNSSPASSQNQRLALATGSLDPSTGIYYRTPEHPRLRTAQACEKCRTRKAKCSGEHPTCKRCLNRGLICEYAKEGRVRGPNKAKSKPSSSGNDTSSNTPVNIGNGHARIGPRGRTSSANSSVGSSEQNPLEAGPRNGLESARRNSLSLGDHRSSRSQPPDLQLAVSDILYRSSTGDVNEMGFPGFPRYQSRGEYSQVDSRQVRSMHQPQMSYHQQSPYQLHREQSMHLQKNMTAVQAHSQGQSIPSPQGRLHGTPHIQTDHLMTLGMPYNVSPLRSPSEEFMYPSPSYLQQQHFQQYPVGNGSRNSISGSASIPIEPVWVNHLGQINTHPQLNSNSEHPIQGADERGQNELSTQIGVMEGQGHTDSQQDHYHGQSQPHNETQHYGALDHKMC